MPRIIDNIDDLLLDNLKYSINNAFRADFCVGYFNLRGWKSISNEIEKFEGGNGNNCRVLIGMQKLPSTTLFNKNISNLTLSGLKSCG